MKNVSLGFGDCFLWEDLYDVLWKFYFWVWRFVFFTKIYTYDVLWRFVLVWRRFFSKHLWYIMCYEDFSFVLGVVFSMVTCMMCCERYIFTKTCILCAMIIFFVLVGDCFFTNIYVMNHEDSFGFGNCSQKIVWCAIKIVFSGFGNCFLMKIYMVYHVNILIYTYIHDSF